MGATCARLFTANDETRSVGGYKKMKRNRMQRERKLERAYETLATVLACVLGIAIACVSSVGRRKGKGKKTKKTRDEI